MRLKKKGYGLPFDIPIELIWGLAFLLIIVGLYLAVKYGDIKSFLNQLGKMIP